jgi:site-specific DNA-methyltransferase (adenine-specific)
MLVMIDLNEENVKATRALFPNAQVLHQDALVSPPEGITIVVGNPPYVAKVRDNHSASQLYDKFVRTYIGRCDLLLFIIPSRWLMASGQGLGKFYDDMRGRTDIKTIHTFVSKNVFSCIYVRGGVQYFLKDKDYSGLPTIIDKENNEPMVLHPSIAIHTKTKSILEKVETLPVRFIEMVLPNRLYDISTNDPRLHFEKQEGDVLCWVSKRHSKDRKKYLKPDEKVLKRPRAEEVMRGYKVIMAYNDDEPFSRLFISEPNEVYSETYVCIPVASRADGERLIHHLSSRLSKFLLDIHRKYVHINKTTLEFIRLPLLESEETNDAILTPEEMMFISSLNLEI